MGPRMVNYRFPANDVPHFPPPRYPIHPSRYPPTALIPAAENSQPQALSSLYHSPAAPALPNVAQLPRPPPNSNTALSFMAAPLNTHMPPPTALGPSSYASLQPYPNKNNLAAGTCTWNRPAAFKTYPSTTHDSQNWNESAAKPANQSTDNLQSSRNNADKYLTSRSSKPFDSSNSYSSSNEAISKGKTSKVDSFSKHKERQEKSSSHSRWHSHRDNADDHYRSHSHSRQSSSRKDDRTWQRRSSTRDRKTRDSRRRSCSPGRESSYKRPHHRRSQSPAKPLKRSSYNHYDSKRSYISEPSDDTKRPRYSSNIIDESSSQIAPESNASEDLFDSAEQQNLSEELDEETNIWCRCSPADLYYTRSQINAKEMVRTEKLKTLHERFAECLLERATRIREAKPKYEDSSKRPILRFARTVPNYDDNSEEEHTTEEEDNAVEELERKRKHPDRLHEELWYNDTGEMNDGPLCRCSARARRSGIRHGIYPGEENLDACNPDTNNANRLYHYRITMTPHTNFLIKTPTVIKHDGHEFIFEGFSLFSHYPLDKLPPCKVIRFNIEYTILYIEEKLPENFTIHCLELFSQYLFNEILELIDLDFKAYEDDDGCNRFHIMPRFVRALEDNGKEILSMNNVLLYLINSSRLLVEETELASLLKMDQYEWQNFADEIKGMIATYPGMKPCSIRVDQLDRDQVNADIISYPEIVHFGIRPLQLSYAGNPTYQKAWREYVKFRHLLANKPKVLPQDRLKLTQKEIRLQEMRTKSNLKRDVTIVVSSQGFYRTGIMCDIVQHAMLIPVLVCHLRFHKSLYILEESVGHHFNDRYLLQLALTHPSYRENFGTNPDHARNSLTNCGIRQPEYGDRRIHYIHTRKRGINTLINIMSRFGKSEETVSKVGHNERLEFLGDAVVEFLTSIHLYHLFPTIEEGGLATYRAAIVQNQHLAVLAKNLELEKYMLYAHGSDLCHDVELRHAMANCLEALMGALFLDGGIDVADRIFSQTLFKEDGLYNIWINYPQHPLQEQETDGDRKYIESVPLLQKLTKFEDTTGVEFTHIRLLARAFTHRSVGFNHLTLGSNQRLEFLGDTVLQLVASEYLYKHFPEHHEGHLSLLRSSLVNNRTQAVVCDDLGMVDFAIYAYPKGELKTKDRADLLEAFLGALYVDKGLEYCQVFCQVCFFPRLQDFIMNQDWNDPKSKLQQCCLTLRTMDGGEPDIPIYKVIESMGPTNTRIFTVAVYFRGERLSTGSGHSIQQAEMAAASKALESCKELFPQLTYQQQVVIQIFKPGVDKKRHHKHGSVKCDVSRPGK